MRGLTICNPYPALILSGEKPIENRQWATNYRGPIAIHAGKSRGWMGAGDDERYPDLVWGAIVGVADFVACLTFGARTWPEAYEHLHRHKHANGPFCWVFQNARRLREPIPYRGAMGLWHVPAPLQSEIERLVA